MVRVQAYLKLFMREPLWFRMLVGISLLASIVLSSSAFPLGGYSEGLSKLAAAVFFVAFGINMRRNRRVSFLFLALAALCLALSWASLP